MQPLPAVGFAFVENVLYLGRTLATGGGSGLAAVFVVRCLVAAFAHPLFTAATGVGLGLAVRTRRPAQRVLLPIVGFALAVALHSAWNLSALSGFLPLYLLVQVPIFAGCVALALLARRREAALIARHLAVYQRAGWLTGAEAEMLASWPARQDARGWAARTGGPAASAAMRDFQELASELAFLRERIVRGAPRPSRARTSWRCSPRCRRSARSSCPCRGPWPMYPVTDLGLLRPTDPGVTRGRLGALLDWSRIAAPVCHGRQEGPCLPAPSAGCSARASATRGCRPASTTPGPPSPSSRRR